MIPSSETKDWFIRVLAGAEMRQVTECFGEHWAFSHRENKKHTIIRPVMGAE